MGQIASEALIERLADWGVDTVFGLPGDKRYLRRRCFAASAVPAAPGSSAVVMPDLAVASNARKGPTRCPSWAGCRNMLSAFTV